MDVRRGFTLILGVLLACSAWSVSQEGAIGKLPAQALDETLSEGYRLYWEGDLAGAESLFRLLLDQAAHVPERGEILLLVAGIREKAMDLTGAVEDYRVLVKYDPATYRDGEYYSYRDFALLRIEYLTSEPTWARSERMTLITELTQALADRDRARCEALAKRGDFWFGWMYSEKVPGRAKESLDYLFRYLPQAEVGEWEEIWEGQWAIPLYPWQDPQLTPPSFYDLLYCTVSRGLFGWEWDGLILSRNEWRNGLR